MAITTCNLPYAAQRITVRELLEKYDDEETTIVEMKALPYDVRTLHHEVLVEGVGHLVTPDELIEVYERRKLKIENDLSKMGISLRAVDEQPSASPRLDAAVRSMQTGEPVTDSVTAIDAAVAVVGNL